jgi:hypothetical protein
LLRLYAKAGYHYMTHVQLKITVIFPGKINEKPHSSN